MKVRHLWVVGATVAVFTLSWNVNSHGIGDESKCTDKQTNCSFYSHNCNTGKECKDGTVHCECNFPYVP